MRITVNAHHRETEVYLLECGDKEKRKTPKLNTEILLPYFLHSAI